MKKVFANHSEVCHVWASQTQSEGRGGNIFFEDNQIYSYGTHYMAAKIYKLNGKQVCLINNHRYSVSTANHLSEIRSAVSHMRTLEVVAPWDPEKSLKEKHAELAEQFFESFSQRSVRWEVDRKYIDESIKNWKEDVEEFNSFCDIFKLKSLKIKFTAEHISLIREKWEQIAQKYVEKNTPEALEKKRIQREKAEERAEKLRTAKVEEAIAIWKAGGPLRNDLKNVRPQLIRIKKDLIETSGGASVKLSEATEVFEKILSNKAKTGDKIGIYTLNGILYDKDIKETVIKVGCHDFAMSEAKAVLGQANLRLIQGGAR